MEFDLVDYLGQEVIINFRYVTDWAYLEWGWAIDDVAVNGEVIDETTLYYPPDPDNDFVVTLIRVKANKNGGTSIKWVKDMCIYDAYEIGFSMTGRVNKDDYILMIVGPDHGPVDYQVGVLPPSCHDWGM